MEVNDRFYWVDKRSVLEHNRPVETVQPNGQLAVNCTGFGCTIKCYFVIKPEFCRVFFCKVLPMAIDMWTISV